MLPQSLAKYKAIIATFAVFSFAALLAFLLAGFFQIIILAALAIALILFSFLFLALKYIELLDKRGYGVVEKVLAYFGIDLPKTTNDQFIHTAYNWLKGVLDQQIYFEAFDLTLEGSFIRGYDLTTFRIIPSVTEGPHYRMIDNKLIIPVNIEIEFSKKSDSEKVFFRNIQHNQLVITETVAKNLCHCCTKKAATRQSSCFTVLMASKSLDLSSQFFTGFELRYFFCLYLYRCACLRIAACACSTFGYGEGAKAHQGYFITFL